MDSLIKRLEQVPVSIENLTKVVPKHTICKLYTDLKKPLFDPGIQCVIVLLQSKTDDIGHFVLLIKRRSSVEYWSSYGHNPQYAIRLTGNDDRLIKLLPKGYVTNRFKFQNETNAETCAMHCLARSIFYQTTNQDYIKMFRYKVTLQKPDDIVTIMTLLHRKLLKQ